MKTNEKQAYEWDENYRKEKAEYFLKNFVVGFENPTMYEISALVLTIFKYLGPILLKDRSIVQTDNVFTRELGLRKSILYKITYDYNTQSSR